MRSTLLAVGLLFTVFTTSHADAYQMATLTYSNLFERAEVVVIATPILSVDSSSQLEQSIDRPQSVTDRIKTVDTEFRVAYLIKGDLKNDTFHLLHLHLKQKRERPVVILGELGTFFIDFDSEWGKKHSFLIFMTRQRDGTYRPAWSVMEGSRAIIPIEKDGDL